MFFQDIKHALFILLVAGYIPLPDIADSMGIKDMFEDFLSVSRLVGSASEFYNDI